MAQQNPASSLPADALARLGLNRQPFSDGEEFVFIFSDAAHKTQINVALHMLQASDRLLVVRGDPGIGKTAFLEGLAQKKTPGLRFCRVTATPELDFDELLYTFMSAVELADPGEELSFGLAAAKLSEAARNGQRPVLLLDSAQLLDHEARARLLSLRQETLADGDAFGLVLAVEPEFDPELEALRESLGGAEQLHIINLYPFSEKQTLDYLTQRLVTAGDREDRLLSEADKRQIFQRSKGTPAAVNAEASRLLAERAGSSVRARGGRDRKLVTMVGAGVVVLAGVLIGAMYYAEHTSEPSTADTKEPSEQQSTGVRIPARFDYEPDQPAQAQTPPVMVAPPGEPGPATQPVAPELDSQAADTAATATGPAASVAAAGESSESTAEAAEPEASASGPAQPAPVQLPEPQAEPQAEPARAEPIAPAPTQAEPAEPATTVPATTATSRGEAWVRARNGAHYTIQVIAAYDRAALMEFIEQYGLGGRAALITTQREGRDWHVVLLGDYDSYAAAKAAVAGLPGKIKESGPWIRKFAAVKKAL